MIETILDDHPNVPACCLYIQNIKYNYRSKSYTQEILSPPERVIDTRSRRMRTKSCSMEKYCSVKRKISVHEVDGRLFYECCGYYFPSYYQARSFLFRKGRKNVRFYGVRELLFDKNQPPSCVKDARLNLMERSRSLDLF
uniref:DUF7381 domain-containing protein n=1 Tax=Strongyloides papillosus TaxID=174720 RepID=A0A0N5B5C7_STREA